jgi:hypothetical protein
LDSFQRSDTDRATGCSIHNSQVPLFHHTRQPQAFLRVDWAYPVRMDTLLSNPPEAGFELSWVTPAQARLEQQITFVSILGLILACVG